MDRLRILYGLSSILLYLNVFIQPLQSAELDGDYVGRHKQPAGDVMDDALKHLSTLSDAQRCNKDTFDKLSAVVGESGKSSHKPSLDCRLVYLERFVGRYEDAALSGFLVQRVEALTDDFIMEDIRTRKSPAGRENEEQALYERVIRGSDEELKGMIRLKTIRKALVHFARRDPLYRAQALSNLSQLFVKYAVIPCEYYVKQFGPNLFDSASFVFGANHKMAHDEADFYFGWTRFRLCRYFSDNSGSISRQLEPVNP